MNIGDFKKIRTQLLISFSVVIALLLSLNLFVIFSHMSIERQYSQITDRMTLEYEISETFSSMINDYTLLIQNMDDIVAMDSYYAASDRIEAIFSSLDDQIVSKDSLSSYNKIKNMVASVKEENERGFSSIRKRDFTEGSGIYDRAIKGQTYVEDNTARLLLSELGYSKSLQQRLNLFKKIITISTFFLVFVITVFCILFVISFSEKISRPLVRLSGIADRISKGYLKMKVDSSLLSRKDETGALSKSFNSMLMRLNSEIESQKKISFDLEKSKNKLQKYSQQLKKENVRTLQREKVKLEALLSSLGEGVIAMDLKGNILIFNEQAEKMFGKSFKSCFGKVFTHLFTLHNEKGERVLMNNYPISTSVMTQKPIVTKLHFLRKGISPLPLSTTMAPVIFQNKIIGIIGTFRDITQEEKVDQAKSEFVSLASHQLQTPLTAIRWFLEILTHKEKLTKRQMEYVKKASVSNQRMIKLVEDFLNVSRLETGRISIYPKTGDFVSFIRGLVEEANVIARKRKQKILFESSDKKIEGFFDSNLMSQVILNLLSNSIHYTPEGKVITVKLLKKHKNLHIEVADEGVGISPEDQKRLFTKFFRTKASSNISTSGSGLGLYIIKKILDTYNGKIKCTSKVGKGTVFVVTIPLKAEGVKGEKQLLEKRIS